MSNEFPIDLQRLHDADEEDAVVERAATRLAIARWRPERRPLGGAG